MRGHGTTRAVTGQPWEAAPQFLMTPLSFTGCRELELWDRDWQAACDNLVCHFSVHHPLPIPTNALPVPQLVLQQTLPRSELLLVTPAGQGVFGELL